MCMRLVCTYVRVQLDLSLDSKVLIMADVCVNKKRSFDAAFKLRVVQYAEMNTNRRRY